MTVIDVHPDDLLDAELSGALTEEQRARLDDHLERCAACRMERVLRADFADELSASGSAPSLSSFVSGALRASASLAPPAAEPTADRDESREGPRAAGEREPADHTTTEAPRARRRRTLVWLAAAAILLATGAAAADGPRVRAALAEVREGLAVAFGAKRAEAPPSPAPHRSAVAPTPATTGNLHTVAPSSEAETATSLAADAPPASAPSLLAAPVAPHERSLAAAPPQATVGAHERHASPLAARLPASGETPAATAPAPSVPLPEIAPSSAAASARPLERPSAADLFDHATDARRRGRIGEARVAYRALQQAHPESAEARLSLAVMARMQLDAGDASAALEGFEAYLSTGDRALREDALVGRALAHERLGRTSDAARSWRALLTAYPGSAYARTARERLGGD